MITKRILFTAVAVTATLMVSACSRDESGFVPASANTDPLVFTDNFAPGVDYQAFLNSKYDATEVDPSGQV